MFARDVAPADFVSGPAAEGRVIRGFEGLNVGNNVGVELVHTDVERGFIDFAVVRRKT